MENLVPFRHVGITGGRTIVPLPGTVAQAAVGLHEGRLADLLTGGDDYELLFTAAP